MGVAARQPQRVAAAKPEGGACGVRCVSGGRRGDRGSDIPAAKLGTVLRSLGFCPTEAEVGELQAKVGAAASFDVLLECIGEAKAKTPCACARVQACTRSRRRPTRAYAPATARPHVSHTRMQRSCLMDWDAHGGACSAGSVPVGFRGPTAADARCARVCCPQPGLT
eukprot:COSAG01_NODE_7021_length_3389_cov_5.565350_2_plen_167_part_00